MSENRAKVYVGVDARFDTEGRIMPLSITWEDGRVYGIDRVLDMRRAASLKAGGAGISFGEYESVFMKSELSHPLGRSYLSPTTVIASFIADAAVIMASISCVDSRKP